MNLNFKKSELKKFLKEKNMARDVEPERWVGIYATIDDIDEFFTRHDVNFKKEGE